MWAQIGVRVTVNALPRTIFVVKAEKLDVSMYLLGWGGPITYAEATLTPVLRMRGPNGIGHFNFGDYRDVKLDELAGLGESSTLNTRSFSASAMLPRTGLTGVTMPFDLVRAQSVLPGTNAQVVPLTWPPRPALSKTLFVFF